MDVTTDRLKRMAIAWKEEEYAPATVNRFFETLRRAYTLGKKATPPLVQLVPEVPSLPEHNVRTGYADHAAVPALLQALDHDPPLRDYVEWLYLTGMRRGAARDLRWADVDLKGGTLRLPAEIEKTRRSRSLPLPAPLREVLERRWAARTAFAKQEGVLVPYVFWRVYDGPPKPGLARGAAVPIIEFRRSWARACKAAGCAGLLVHDFRRTAARTLRLAGVDREHARRFTGHRTDAMFSRYNIDDDLQLREAADKYAAFITAQRAQAQNASTRGHGTVAPETNQIRSRTVPARLQDGEPR